MSEQPARELGKRDAGLWTRGRSATPRRMLHSALTDTTTTAMLRLRPTLCRAALSRQYATASGPHALVFLEHREGAIDSGSLSALTAAQQLGGQVTGLVIGAPDQVAGVVEKAKR